MASSIRNDYRFDVDLYDGFQLEIDRVTTVTRKKKKKKTIDFLRFVFVVRQTTYGNCKQVLTVQYSLK